MRSCAHLYSGSTRPASRLLVALCAAVLCVFTPAGAPDQAHSQTGASGMPPLVGHDPATGSVRFIGSVPGSPISRPAGLSTGASPAAVARLFLARSGGPLGIGVDAGDLTLSAVRNASAGRTVVRFQQTSAAVPVLGGEVVVNLDPSGNILSVVDKTLPATDLSVVPRVRPSAARRTAIAATARARGVAASALRASAPRLWIYDSALLGSPGSGRPMLAWRTDVTSRGVPVDELVLVDAQGGAVALHFSQIEQAKSRRVCDAHNTSSQEPCRAPVRVEGGPPSPSRDVNDAYRLTGAAYDFYLTSFGRDSLDGAGMQLVSTVRWCDPSDRRCPWPGAAWDGESQQVFFGQGFAAADDVVGHELTHAVVDHSSNLFYYFESGAIAESIADTLGELFDQTNGTGTDTRAVRWLIGEDAPGGALRDMKHPTRSRDSQPDRMRSGNYDLDPELEDSGGVHTNSGIGNKAAFLITDGGTFNGRTVTGLGPAKAAKIYYELATNQLTSASDYGDLYYALPQACRNLVGTAGITEADCDQVVAAVNAVEMYVDRREAAVCPGGGTAHDLFHDDLENPASGNWALGPGASDVWHYPQSPDRTYARSGHTNFWGDDWSGRGADSIAMTRSVHIPEEEAVYLHFAHAYDFISGRFISSGNPANFTGGVVEYRTDGGEWTDAGPLWDEDGHGYDGRISGYGPGFVGTSSGYGSSRASLGSLAGQDVRLRFTIDVYWSEDAMPDRKPDVWGWFVDDVRVYTCSSHPPRATIGGPSGPVAGRDATWTFSATDAAPDDQAGVFLYTVDWDSDGRVDATVTGGSSVSLTHPYMHPGRQTIRATAADHHGSASRSATRKIVVRPPVQVASRSLVLTPGGLVAVKVRSLATTSYAATVTLRSAFRLQRAGRKRYVLLGSAKQTIGAGETARVKVRLTPAGRALVERLGHVRVRVTVLAGGRVTRTLVLSRR